MINAVLGFLSFLPTVECFSPEKPMPTSPEDGSTGGREFDGQLANSCYLENVINNTMRNKSGLILCYS